MKFWGEEGKKPRLYPLGSGTLPTFGFHKKTIRKQIELASESVPPVRFELTTTGFEVHYSVR